MLGFNLIPVSKRAPGVKQNGLQILLNISPYLSQPGTLLSITLNLYAEMMLSDYLQGNRFVASFRSQTLNRWIISYERNRRDTPRRTLNLIQFTNCNRGVRMNNSYSHVCYQNILHYSDVIKGAMASQITGVSIACSTVCSGADQRKYQSSSSLAFVKAIHRRPVDSPHKGPVRRKMLSFDDVIMAIQWDSIITQYTSSDNGITRWIIQPICWGWSLIIQ